MFQHPRRMFQTVSSEIIDKTINEPKTQFLALEHINDMFNFPNKDKIYTMDVKDLKMKDVSRDTQRQYKLG